MGADNQAEKVIVQIETTEAFVRHMLLFMNGVAPDKTVREVSIKIRRYLRRIKVT